MCRMAALSNGVSGKVSVCHGRESEKTLGSRLVLARSSSLLSPGPATLSVLCCTRILRALWLDVQLCKGSDA